jgi:hypothetical protein
MPIVSPTAPLEQVTLICPVAFNGAVAFAPTGSYVVNARAAEVLIAQFCVTLADTGTEVVAVAASVTPDSADIARAIERHAIDFLNMATPY